MVTRLKNSGPTKMALSCSLAKDWVRLHYERNEEGVVAKSVMYKHYEDECREKERPLMETSIFGRIVKSIFPDVNIRRLGGRDNLKYYYCGIQAKLDSKYYEDNAKTTKPKRRLRKRELVTDKADVHRCIKWLHSNYVIGSDCSVVKAEVYDSYTKYCTSVNSDPLSLQYFGMVITHVFPRITKRKLGPRANQQKYYFGIQERPNPISIDALPNDIISSVFETVFNKGRLEYREGLDEDEEDDQYCPSPISDTSELSPVGQEQHYDHGDMQVYNTPSSLIKQERIEDNFSNIQLKDEPLDDEQDYYSCKQIDDDHEYDSCKPLDLSKIMYRPIERITPDRPPSPGTYGSSSPSPPVKEKSRIYKPRFHYSYNTGWDNDSDLKTEKGDMTYCNDSMDSERCLRDWITTHLEECKSGSCADRDQIFSFYEKMCMSQNVSPVPITDFDINIFQVFSGVTTKIQSPGKTYYEGIRINAYSPLLHYVDKLPADDDYQWNDSMDMSPSAESSSHNSHLDSPIPLEDEDEEETPDEAIQLSYPMDNELYSTPEVLRDGKYYLKMWLTENFESIPNSCVLKADAYKYYDEFARSISQTPFEMNVFGKIVRQVFPNVSIRRLGGRVKPQYHYCGIGVKKTSQLYNLMSGKDPAQRSRKKEIATDNRSAEVVIEWLRQNYVPGKERIIMKSEVFNRYTQFCAQNKETPVTLNYFGKLVKHCFPEVEVRKFGGRSEPTWYYNGLYPIAGNHSEGATASCDDFNNPQDRCNSIPYDIHMQLNNQIGLGCQGMPPSREERSRLPHYSSSPIPIGVNNANNHVGTPINGSYGSASVIVTPVMLNHRHSISQSPLAGQQGSPYSQLSPREQHNIYVIESRSRHAGEQVYVGSPVDAHHSYRERVVSRSPAEGGGLKEMTRHLATRSPHESADVPPDTIFSRSPGDTAAQISRSPASVLSPNHSFQNTPEITSNYSEVLHMARSPKDTILYSRSPVEGLMSPELQQRILGGSLPSNGCQVVPSQTPPGTGISISRSVTDQNILHQPNIKRHKGQIQLGDEYEMVRDMSHNHHNK